MSDKDIRSALNELIKTYHIFASFDPQKGRELLKQINDIRLSLVMLAEQRQIFWKQTNVPVNSSGYTQDLFVTSDDIRSSFSRFVAYLQQDVKLGLIQQGTREVVFTRERVAWQQIASAVQSATTGQNYPFDLPQEIFLEKNHSLNFAVTDQQTNGMIFSHGANLKDDYAPNKNELITEINMVTEDGTPLFPQTVLVPIQFKFNSNLANAVAVSVNGSTDIYSNKDSRSILLTDVATTSRNSRWTLIDNGRNQLLCDTVEAEGIAGFYTNQYSTYYPLPYPHLLRKQDRLQLKALNGSSVTGANEAQDTIFTICFRGFTI